MPTIEPLLCWSPTCSKEVSPAAAACAACGSPLRIRDKYRIVRVLGQGGMGLVYEAVDETLGRHVALKVMHGRFGAQSKHRERFQIECRAMAALDHPGIARIYDADAHHDQLFFVQALVRGRPLRDWMVDWAQGSTAPARATAVAVAIELLEALDHAHGQGIVHRDINPNNVMMVERGGSLHPVIIDFGMARTADQAVTKVAWGGTPGHAAPEQILEPMSNDRRSDLYGVAALLYAVLARGAVPYGESLDKGISESPKALLATYQRIASGLVPLAGLAERDSGMPAELERAIARALAPDPAKRFQTATEMIAALRPFLAAGAALSPPAAAPSETVSLPEGFVPVTALPGRASRPSATEMLPGPTFAPQERAELAPAPAPPSTISALVAPTTASAGVTTGSAASPPRRRRAWLLAAGLLVLAFGAGVTLRHAGLKGGAATSSASGAAAAPSGSAGEAAASAPLDKAAAVAPFTGPPLRVGVLHSMSGTMALSERQVVDATLLAVDEVNAEGGVLGRKVEALVEDGKSDDATFARAAEKLLDEDKVVTVFGTWTSSSRKAVLPLFEQRRSLLVYPVQYEGLETSPNIYYLGATANQQVIPAVRFCGEKLHAKRFFLVGSDYIYPRAAAEIIRDEVKTLGGQIVGEHYALLGETAFGPVVQRIKAVRPDVILNLINGDSNLGFFRALRELGITSAQTPTVSFSITDGSFTRFRSAGIETRGDYLAWSYFQALSTPENKSFVQRFQARYGAERVVVDPMEAAYAGVRIWARAVQEAGTTETSVLLRTMDAQTYAAPEGQIRIDPSTNHAWKFFRMGKIGEDGAVEIVDASEAAIEPVPFPFTRTRAEWEALLNRLSAGWKGGWANPQKPVGLR